MSFVKIDIKGVDELSVDINRLRDGASFRWPKEILDTSSEMMADAIRDEAPRGLTGALANSVRAEGAGDTRRVVVGSPYGAKVNDGTGPSPGRYVRAIGKRIKGGMHPGTRANPFFDRAVSMVTPRIFGYMHRRIYEYLLE